LGKVGKAKKKREHNLFPTLIREKGKREGKKKKEACSSCHFFADPFVARKRGRKEGRRRRRNKLLQRSGKKGKGKVTGPPLFEFLFSALREGEKKEKRGGKKRKESRKRISKLKKKKKKKMWRGVARFFAKRY